jgi:hypothetical protein
MSRLRLRQKASMVEGLVSICFQGIEVLILAHSRSHSLLFGDCAVDEWSNTSALCSTRCLMREDSLALLWHHGNFEGRSQ